MRTSRIAILALMTTGFLYAGQGRAALLTFDFTGTDPGASSSWTQTSELDPHLQITTGLHIYTPRDGTVSPSTGLTSHGDANAFSVVTEYGNGTVGDVDSAGRQTIGQSIANSYWIGFTIAPAAGYELNLNGADIDLMVSMNDNWNGPRMFPVFTSIGGFADGDELNNNVLSGTPALLRSFTVTLPATGYDHITDPLEIRVLTAAGKYYKWTQINDLSIASGSVDAVAAVPEPASAALLLGAFVPLLVRRRRN